ncbi:MAG: nucleoside recognition domain-containing protein, partial [Anaerovorax sp.]
TGWFSTILSLAKILIPLMIIIEILRVYHIMERLADKLQFLAKSMGMEKQSIFPLLVGVTMGVTYGAGTLIEINKETPISKKDYTLIGIFLFLCHGIIETALIFGVAGANIFFITVFRLIFAFIVTVVASKLPFIQQLNNDQLTKKAKGNNG